MNEISTLFDFLINHFKSNIFVNTISIVPTLEIDHNKENLYPLVNIDIQDSEITTATVTASFIITIVEQRDTRPTVTDSKLLDDTNFIDNLNETHAIGQRFINVLEQQNNLENVELTNTPNFKFLKNWSRNNLDGVQFTADLSINNNGLSC